MAGILPQGAGLLELAHHGDRSGIASVLEHSLGSPGQAGAMTAPAGESSGEAGLPLSGDAPGGPEGGSGGGSQGAGKQLGESLLGGVSKYYAGVSKLTGMVAKLGIPEISQFAALGSVAAKAASEGAGLGVTKLRGGDMGQAEHQALGAVGQTAESQALNALRIPGGSKLLGGFTEKSAVSGGAS